MDTVAAFVSGVTARAFFYPEYSKTGQVRLGIERIAMGFKSFYAALVQRAAEKNLTALTTLLSNPDLTDIVQRFYRANPVLKPFVERGV